MAHILVYSRFRTTAWWRYIASQLDCATSSTIASDFQGDGDFYVMADFYRNLDSPDMQHAAEKAFGESVCADIVARCRLLRILDPVLAMKMVNAMCRTLEELLEREGPALILSFCIDYYAVDILERLGAVRGLPFVGLSAAPVSGRALVSVRGEHTFVREPSDEEVEEALAMIVDASFAPYLPERPRYDKGRFVRELVRSRAREAAFALIARKNHDPLNYHYWLPKPNMGYRVRARDWGVQRFVRHDWRMQLEATPFERRVFVPLPVQPESTIDYWVKSRDLLDYDAVLEQLLPILSDAGYVLFLKDHPNMFAIRSVDLIERLASIDNVVLVPYEVTAPELITKCKGLLTSGGTAGVQAALAEKSAVILDSYYYMPGPFIRLGSAANFINVAGELASFVPSTVDDEGKRELVRHILRTCFFGDAASWRGFRADRPTSVEKVRSLVSSLNAYLPALI